MFDTLTRPRALTAGLGVLAITAGAVVLGSGGAAGASATVNPFADAGGFSVYVRGDATLDNSEIEGSLAVGGTLDAAGPGSRLSIVHKVAGTSAYTIPTIDSDPTRLLVGAVAASSGIIDVSGHDGDSGLHWGFAKVITVDEPTWVFAERGGYTQYRLNQPGTESNGPVIDARNQPWATEGRASMIAAGPSVASYVENGIGVGAVSACLAELGVSDDAHQVVVTNDGGKARLDLTAGVVNVVDYADLYVFGSTFASQITYADDVPAADTPVVVRVAAGTTDVRGIEFGTSGEYARFVMWDLSAVTGAVTVTDKQGGMGRVDGSIFAPYAALTLMVGPLDGQVIADTLTTPSGAGELHAYMFSSMFTCAGAPEPTASPSPSVSPSTTPSMSPSTTPGEAPGVPTSASPTASGEGEDGPTADPTATLDAGVAGPDAQTDSLARTGANATLLAGISLALGAVGTGILLMGSRRRA